jgi:hypothetical protein
MTGIVPMRPRLAPCSPPSRPLRAGSAGAAALAAASLTAAARGALPGAGRGKMFEACVSGQNQKLIPASG